MIHVAIDYMIYALYSQILCLHLLNKSTKQSYHIIIFDATSSHAYTQLGRSWRPSMLSSTFLLLFNDSLSTHRSLSLKISVTPLALISVYSSSIWLASRGIFYSYLMNYLPSKEVITKSDPITINLFPIQKADYINESES